MAYQQFQISQVNPNDVPGGGGCVCDEMHQTDCKPPYAVFYGSEMESSLSPHVVLCQSCAERVVERMRNEAPLHISVGTDDDTLVARRHRAENVNVPMVTSRPDNPGEGESSEDDDEPVI